MQYRILPRADADLDEITIYLADEGGTDITLRFLDGVRDTLSLLTTEPLMGRVCRFSAPTVREIRMFRVGGGFEKILVFYRAVGDCIEIVRGAPRCAGSGGYF